MSFFAAPLVLRVKALMDGSVPRTLAGLWLVTAGLAGAAVLATATSEQLTTLSEPALFRPATVLFTIAIFWVSLRMVRVKDAEIVGAEA